MAQHFNSNRLQEINYIFIFTFVCQYPEKLSSLVTKDESKKLKLWANPYHQFQEMYVTDRYKWN